jgi:hypothetical protein
MIAEPGRASTMIGKIYLLGIVVAILVNVRAVTLIVLRYIPFPAAARVTGILIVCLALFSLEHFIGLGKLYPVFIPLTALSVYVIWQERFLDEIFRTSEFVFLCALLYGAVWRLAFPEIGEDNDRLTDFHLVSNYLSGARLPPLDNWLPDQRLAYYYTFQHYAAALLGRIFGLGPGTSFNLAAIILGALVLTLAWEFLTLLRIRFGLKLLSVAALAIGGTGISPLFHLVTSAPPDDFLSYGSALHAFYKNSRFVGWFETSVASDAWRALFGGETHRSVMLPIETFGYQYGIGGYHAVLSGFLLLFLALAMMAAVPQSSKAVRQRLEFVLGLTVPLTLCSGAWVFPLQSALVGAWKFWDRRTSGHRDLRYLGSGAAVGVLLLLPFLAGLGIATKHMQLQLVSMDAHTPIAQFLIVWWPLLALVLTFPLVGQASSLAGLLAVLFLSLLVFTEFINVFDGAYGGDWIRFNPALKWWGWIFTGGIFSLSAFLLAGKRRAGRLVAAVVLVLISVFAVDSSRYLVFRSHAFAGIDGEGFYAQNLANARMLHYLTDAPPGIVLEKVYDDPPLDTGVYGSFAQKPNLVGIPWVLLVWKSDLTELPGLVAEIRRFYAGTHEHATRFLTDHGVRYVVWSVRESQGVEKWKFIMQSIDAEYRWMEFSQAPDTHIGLWIRR